MTKSNNPTCEAGMKDGVYYTGYWQGGVCMGILTPQPNSNNTIDAKINGTITEGSNNVFVNNKEVTFKNAKTTESDTYNLPSGWNYVSGKHTNTNGAVNQGSSKVFVNGKEVSRKGDNVRTHANTTTTIKDGSSNVFAN